MCSRMNKVDNSNINCKRLSLGDFRRLYYIGYWISKGNKEFKMKRKREKTVMPNDKKFAVLIDADNISDKYIKVILDEISNDGIATYKRIYGDWTKPALGQWKKVLLEHSITPMQQYGYTTGKNATDSAMIIDAMDILYSGNVDGFCLVSSDSDFTRLASRLRESGMDVVGMGEKKTPKAFISACNKFKYLDILSGQVALKRNEPKSTGKKSSKSLKTVKNAKSERQESEKVSAKEDALIEKETKGKKLKEINEKTYKSVKDAKTGKYTPEALGILIVEDADESDEEQMTSMDTIRRAIATIVEENSDEDEWVFIGDIGNRLTKRYPDFDVRNYGFNKLTPFIKSLELFEIRAVASGSSNNKLVYVKEKSEVK